MTEQKDSRHPKATYSDSLPTGQDEYPYNWDAPQLDWRTLPLDEIMHRRFFDDYQSQR